MVCCDDTNWNEAGRPLSATLLQVSNQGSELGRGTTQCAESNLSEALHRSKCNLLSTVYHHCLPHMQAGIPLSPNDIPHHCGSICEISFPAEDRCMQRFWTRWERILVLSPAEGSTGKVAHLFTVLCPFLRGSMTVIGKVSDGYHARRRRSKRGIRCKEASPHASSWEGCILRRCKQRQKMEACWDGFDAALPCLCSTPTCAMAEALLLAWPSAFQLQFPRLPWSADAPQAHFVFSPKHTLSS